MTPLQAHASKFALPSVGGDEEGDAASDIASTEFLDTQLLTALALVNMEKEAEYRQVCYMWTFQPAFYLTIHMLCSLDGNRMYAESDQITKI